MKTPKKFFSLFLAVLLIGALFSGCSKSESMTDEITEDTLIFAYTAENSPFIYTDESGAPAGFDVELVEKTFDSFKGDYTSYAFIQVEDGYVLGEDVCYTDSAGNEYTALIYCGGFAKNTGTVNEDYTWSSNIIENSVITVVPAGSAIASYNDVAGCNAAVVSAAAAAALAKNSAVQDVLKSAAEYASAGEAFTALDSGAVDMVIIDEFSFYQYEQNSAYTAIPGALDTVEYAFAFARSEDFSSAFNEAVKELQSADYGNGDELTPMVTQYFPTADLCVFQYATEGDE